ncbi:restriction endonuclease subunit S [Roseofilum reptotaenium CS-1145]|uniref:Type I restriction modification DNA specificity domain-containing protein n=1 Tax=Roseofilum reptotaenium AO1-A TaxID=1925591 RepID=A0A1L9QWT9_9CYAN|nr:restriction endonuclease subunit S [Roseofilum reptotaenium]MDB9516916.1 restriction endonuclease subunit S [Roseofilum reptotaenium CS-1145]OJJ27124.1 hypothetical protein BI308_03505 [Roseofilum reptotaenium AO1-A]
MSSRWKTRKLGEIVKIDRSSVQASKIKSGTKYVGLEHITGEGQFVKVRRVQTGDLASSKFAFSDSHLLYGKLRPYLKKIACPNFSGICSTDILPILPTSVIDKKFLYYFLRQPQYIQLATVKATGVNLPRVSPQTLTEFLISFPPIEEQRRIAAILDKADEIRRKRQEAIALTDELLRSTFLEMFGNPVTNPMGWEIINLKKVIRDRPSNGIFKKNQEYGGKVPVIWVKELFSGYTIDCNSSRTLNPTDEEVRKFGLKKGDILFCRSSLKLEGVGYNNVFDKEDYSALFECHIIRISPDPSKINSIFLNYFLRLPASRKRLISMANTVTMSTISQDVVMRISVLLPPKRLQDEFESILRRVTSTQENLLVYSNQSNNLFNSLLQKAFKGEL